MTRRDVHGWTCTFLPHVSLLMVPTSRGWQHFFIWSIAWAVATCSGVYNGRGPALLPLSKTAIRKSHFYPQHFLYGSSSSVLNVTECRLQLLMATLEQQQRCAGEGSTTGEHKVGLCSTQYTASPEEIKLPPLKHWPTLTARKVFSEMLFSSLKTLLHIIRERNIGKPL